MKNFQLLILLAVLLFPSITHAAYDPTEGRWLSRDPIAETGGINLYDYVLNNPVDSIDPFGLQTVLLTPFPPEYIPIPPEMLDTAIRLNGENGNRVNLPDGRAVDLAGRSHFDKATQEEVPTPHTHCPKPANPAPYDQFPPKLNPVPRPSTIEDIQDVINHLLNNVNSIINNILPPPMTPEQRRYQQMMSQMA